MATDRHQGPSLRDGFEATPAECDPQLLAILGTAVASVASDVILRSAFRPQLRVNGLLYPWGERDLTGQDTSRMLRSMLNEQQRLEFEETHEIDAAFQVEKVGRFRLNAYRQQQETAMVLRVIPAQMPTVESLELPQAIRDMANYPRGLVLVTGPTGCGKSTLLAALIHKINCERACHVVTIEDPIEFVHTGIRAAICQREVGRDTRSFANALKGIFRQSPDVILVGEMRDAETMAATLTLAETGHLVLSTLHTQTCAQTISRILDSFPSAARPQIQTQLALTLRGVVCQLLLPTPDGTARVAAREIMVVNRAISTLIREQKIQEIPSYIQASAQVGMVTMRASIEGLIAAGLVDREEGLSKLTRLELPPASLHSADLAASPLGFGPVAARPPGMEDPATSRGSDEGVHPLLMITLLLGLVACAYAHFKGDQVLEPLKLDHLVKVTGVVAFLCVVQFLASLLARWRRS